MHEDLILQFSWLNLRESDQDKGEEMVDEEEVETLKDSQFTDR